jgi:hypothetical protein
MLKLAAIGIIATGTVLGALSAADAKGPGGGGSRFSGGHGGTSALVGRGSFGGVPGSIGGNIGGRPSGPGFGGGFNGRVPDFNNGGLGGRPPGAIGQAPGLGRVGSPVAGWEIRPPVGACPGCGSPPGLQRPPGSPNDGKPPHSGGWRPGFGAGGGYAAASVVSNNEECFVERRVIRGVVRNVRSCADPYR